MTSASKKPEGSTNEERAALKDRVLTPYPTLGFSDKARLGDGVIWPTAFAITELTDAVEVRITNLVKKAAS